MTRIATLVAVVLCVLFVVDAGAVSTKSWTVSTYKEFDEGEADAAHITSRGEVRSGIATERVNLETDSIWTAVRAPDGTIYAGGVTGGNVFSLAPGKGKKAETLVSLDEDSPWIGALALGSGGTLYAGTLGTAAVYRVDIKTKKAEKLVSLEDAEHVWALVLDADDQTLYAATGPEGKLYAVDTRARKASLLWESDEKHLLSMIRARDGALWVGTADEAILYRIDPGTKRGRAIADFAGTEVKGIVEVEGAFVVAVNDFDKKSTSVPSPPKTKTGGGTKAKVPKAGTAPGAASKKSSKQPTRKGAPKGKGAIFRVEPDGRVEQLHAQGKGYFMTLAVDSRGHVFAGEGTEGTVYEVYPDRTVVTAFDVKERQVTAILTNGGAVAFCTGDTAAIHVATGPAAKAEYLSEVHDADYPARWGKVRWRASGKDLILETRSGNTSKPDKAWSDWEAPRKIAPAGGGAMAGSIASPPGRYLQFRARWKGKAEAVLKEVTVYYLPQNQRARITEVSVSRKEGRKDFVTTEDGPSKPRSPELRIKWSVDNPDKDELAYVVEYREVGAVEWRSVPSKEEPLTKTTLDWNTEALPDGYYRIRVTASDARVNPPGLALSHQEESRTFLIDNQKPDLLGVTVKGRFVSGRASDSFSRITEIAYSVDNGDWVVVFPKDGLFDEPTELFTFELPKEIPAGAHLLSIRTADDAGNIGALSLTFRIP